MNTTTDHADVLIIGANLSGIGGACHRPLRLTGQDRTNRMIGSS